MIKEIKKLPSNKLAAWVSPGHIIYENTEI